MTKIIDSYDTLPIGLYLDILNVNEDEALDDLGRQCAIISILTGLKESDVLRLPLDEYAALSAKLAFLSIDVPQPKRSIGKTFAIGDHKYTVPHNPAKITTAQFVDFRTYAGQWKDGVRPVPELLSTMLVPEGKSYATGYEPEDVQKDIRENLNTTAAFALCAFFLTSWKQFIEVSLSSLERPLKLLRRKGQAEKAEAIRKQITEIRTALQASGPGLTTLLPLPAVRILRGTPFGTWDASNS